MGREENTQMSWSLKVENTDGSHIVTKVYNSAWTASDGLCKAVEYYENVKQEVKISMLSPLGYCILSVVTPIPETSQSAQIG